MSSKVTAFGWKKHVQASGHVPCSRPPHEPIKHKDMTSGNVAFLLLLSRVKAQKHSWFISGTVTQRQFIHIILESVKITGIFIAQEEVCVVWTKSFLNIFRKGIISEKNDRTLILCGALPQPATL